jgi:hypothetical protein
MRRRNQEQAKRWPSAASHRPARNFLFFSNCLNRLACSYPSMISLERKTLVEAAAKLKRALAFAPYASVWTHQGVTGNRRDWEVARCTMLPDDIRRASPDHGLPPGMAKSA